MQRSARRASTARRPLPAALRLLSIVLAWALLGAYHWVAPAHVEATASVRVRDRACVTPRDGRRALVESTAPTRLQADAPAPSRLDVQPGSLATRGVLVPPAARTGLADALEIPDGRPGEIARVPVARGPPSTRA